MKTNVKRLLLAGPILAFILITFNAFKPAAAGNRYANGGGIANGKHFNFNAVQQKDGFIVGHLQWGDDFYKVECIQWINDGSKTVGAILYTDGANGKKAIQVIDNGEGSKGSPDTISDPVTNYNFCGIGEYLIFTSYEVSDGNIQVK